MRHIRSFLVRFYEIEKRMSHAYITYIKKPISNQNILQKHNFFIDFNFAMVVCVRANIYIKIRFKGPSYLFAHDFLRLPKMVHFTFDIRRHAITWINAHLLSIGPLGTNFSEIQIKILKFSFKKVHLKMSSAKWRPFCPWGDDLNSQKCPYLTLASELRGISSECLSIVL